MGFSCEMCVVVVGAFLEVDGFLLRRGRWSGWAVVLEEGISCG